MIAEPKTVADDRPLGIVGVASQEIPVTNAAGLLQCSPANTDQALTKPRDGALDLRAAQPDRINYIRTAPADDIQGPALASFVFRDLGARRDAGHRRRRRRPRDRRRLQRGLPEARRRGRPHRTLNKGADPATVLDALDRPGRPIGRVLRRLHRHRSAGDQEGHGGRRTRRGPVRELGRHLGRDRRGRGLVPPGGRTRRGGVVLLARHVRAAEGGLRRTLS